MKVFKFGGASVKDASSVLNVAEILNLYTDDLVVVVSAMGKTTNLMEELTDSFIKENKEELEQVYKNLYNLHYQIVADLGLTEDIDFITLFEYKFDELEQRINTEPSDNKDYVYDQIVSFGEIISTTIISGFLNFINMENCWFDARKLIRTDNKYRSANVNWNKTNDLINKKIGTYLKDTSKRNIAITQGFIGHTDTKQTTTLGREGSDFSASILAWSLNAEDVTIWKDVPGMLNADPKYFNNCVKLDQISFKEAIELSYYGASVIHPKTLKPLENKNIPLYVRSFYELENKGTTVSEGIDLEPKIACYTLKENQILVAISAKDFSFMVEENLSDIFKKMHEFKLKVNLIQNSALSFSVCIGDKFDTFQLFLNEINLKYKVSYTAKVVLYTIRHSNKQAVKSIEQKGKLLLKQSTKGTVQLIMQ